MFISNKLQYGFSMVEVLVSLVVIGSGLLGLSGLQIASMKATNNAHSRNVASMLGLGLSDRMRANPLGVEGNYYAANVNCEKKERLCRGNKFCTPEETARFDVQEVMCGMLKSQKSTVRNGGVVNLLPNGSLQVSCTDKCNTSKAEYDVTLGWNDSNIHPDQAGSTQPLSITIPIIP